MRFYNSPIPIASSIEDKQFFDELIQDTQKINTIDDSKEGKLDLDEIHLILKLSSQ
jgi:hypothetical protein